MTDQNTDNRYRNLQRAMYAGCGVALVCVVIIFALLMIGLNNINSYSYNTIYDQDTITTTRAIIISFGVLSIVLELLGIWGANKEIYWLCIIYSLFSSILAGLCLWGGIYGGGGLLYFLLVVFFVSACFGSYFAKDIKRLEKSAPGSCCLLLPIPALSDL